MQSINQIDRTMSQRFRSPRDRLRRRHSLHQHTGVGRGVAVLITSRPVPASAQDLMIIEILRCEILSFNTYCVIVSGKQILFCYYFASALSEMMSSICEIIFNWDGQFNTRINVPHNVHMVFLINCRNSTLLERLET